MTLSKDKKKWLELLKEESGYEISAGPALDKDGFLHFPEESGPEVNWDRFPIKEMVKLGWVKAKITDIQKRPEELIKRFISFAGSNLPVDVLCRSTIHENSAKTMDQFALLAWTIRVSTLANQQSFQSAYKKGTVDMGFMTALARLSKHENGPIRAQDFLAEHGIALLVERHLSHTYLDGAAMLSETGNPVIALSARHDRLDNFWFTLLHELAHVAFHLHETNETFVDNTERESCTPDRREVEADLAAQEALIPRSVWLRSDARHQQTAPAIRQLAEELGIHPAIIAGRLRREKRNYKILTNMVGQGEVRQLFPDVQWSS